MKKSLLFICKILGLFFNTVTVDDKYSLFKRDNLTQPTQVQLSQKQKALSQFFAEVWKSRLNFNIFKNKLTFRANVFTKLRTPKDVVR